MKYEIYSYLLICNLNELSHNVIMLNSMLLQINSKFYPSLSIYQFLSYLARIK